MKRVVVLTNHARQQMSKRIGCSLDKQVKLACKAWASEEFVDTNEVANAKFYEAKNSEETIYKKLMGLVYVFTLRGLNIVLLVTVYNPVNQLARKKAKKAKMLLGTRRSRDYEK